MSLSFRIAEADPCTQISRQFISGLQQHLPAGTLIYGPQVYPSIKAESLVFVPATPQTDHVEVTIDGKERIDLRAAYIRTGNMRFRSLAAVAGCDLYDDPEFIDFEKIPDAFAVSKPTLFLVSYCSGNSEQARLVSVQDAFLFHATGQPFCVLFEPDLFDPFGLAECSKEKEHIAPWESVKEISVLIRAPAAGDYSVDLRLATTFVSDERCIGCYPEVDCKPLTSTQTSNTQIPLKWERAQVILPLPAISRLDFERRVTAFELQLTLRSGSAVLHTVSISPEWPRCC